MKLCECGCGKPSPIASRNNKERGHKRGSPTRFLPGHWSKTKAGRENTAKRTGEKHPNWKPQVTYGNLHSWLNRRYPRVGSCEECGNSPTEYANISKQYLRERSDWKELCRRCHRSFDGARGESHHNAKLSRKDVEYIRKAFAADNHPTQKELAEKFNVSRGLIGHIVRFRNWR